MFRSSRTFKSWHSTSSSDLLLFCFKPSHKEAEFSFETVYFDFFEACFELGYLELSFEAGSFILLAFSLEPTLGVFDFSSDVLFACLELFFTFGVRDLSPRLSICCYEFWVSFGVSDIPADSSFGYFEFSFDNTTGVLDFSLDGSFNCFESSFELLYATLFYHPFDLFRVWLF